MKLNILDKSTKYFMSSLLDLKKLTNFITIYFLCFANFYFFCALVFFTLFLNELIVTVIELLALLHQKYIVHFDNAQLIDC